MYTKLPAIFTATVLSLVAAGAAATAAPAAVIATTPRLYAATPAPTTPGRPTTWIVFATRKHVDPRLLVATVDGRSGRSYRIAGPNCVRSTIVSKDGAARVTPGHRHTVRIYSRTSTGRTSPRTLVATKTVTSHAFAVRAGGARAPGCTPPPATTSRSAMTNGVRRFFARLHAHATSAAHGLPTSTGGFSGFVTA
jgi:hypothetical protein